MAETAQPVTMDTIVSLCRRRGFVFPSSEIYGGLGSTYDYGHYGVLTKNNIRSLWFRAMVQERDDIVALDSAIILNPSVWEASGHVAGFTDPLVDCRTCKLRFRADQLEQAHCGRKPSKRPGASIPLLRKYRFETLLTLRSNIAIRSDVIGHGRLKILEANVRERQDEDRDRTRDHDQSHIWRLPVKHHAPEIIDHNSDSIQKINPPQSSRDRL